jgi:hypothetical protein
MDPYVEFFAAIATLCFLAALIFMLLWYLARKDAQDQREMLSWAREMHIEIISRNIALERELCTSQEMLELRTMEVSQLEEKLQTSLLRDEKGW